MHRPLPIPTAVLAGALALGCADPQSPTVPMSSSLSSPASARSPNASGGAIILRGSFAIGFFFSDPDRGLTTVIGNTAAELALVCAGLAAPSEFSVLGVIRPTGAFKLLLKNEEAEVAVWQLVSDDFCGVLATTPPYAEGTARVRAPDNDVEFPIEPGGNASTIHALGTVTVLETGEDLHYQAHLHSIVKPGGTTFADIQVLAEEIRLH